VVDEEVQSGPSIWALGIALAAVGTAWLAWSAPALPVGAPTPTVVVPGASVGVLVPSRGVTSAEAGAARAASIAQASPELAQAHWVLPTDLVLAGSSSARMREVVGQAAKCTGLVEVTGHTCDVGDAADNERLSLQRAELVALALRSAGFPAERLRLRGLGEQQPLVRGADDAARQANRRVEVTCTPQR
jgi:hypothetical protein